VSPWLDGAAIEWWTVVEKNAVDDLIGKGASMSDFLDVVRNEVFVSFASVDPKMTTVDEDCNLLVHRRKLLRPKELPPWACIVPAYGRIG
jgi:hypothetical protein